MVHRVRLPVPAGPAVPRPRDGPVVGDRRARPGRRPQPAAASAVGGGRPRGRSRRRRAPRVRVRLRPHRRLPRRPGPQAGRRLRLPPCRAGHQPDRPRVDGGRVQRRPPGRPRPVRREPPHLRHRRLDLAQAGEGRPHPHAATARARRVATGAARRRRAPRLPPCRGLPRARGRDRGNGQRRPPDVLAHRSRLEPRRRGPRPRGLRRRRRRVLRGRRVRRREPQRLPGHRAAGVHVRRPGRRRQAVLHAGRHVRASLCGGIRPLTLGVAIVVASIVGTVLL